MFTNIAGYFVKTGRVFSKAWMAYHCFHGKKWMKIKESKLGKKTENNTFILFN